MGSSVRTLLLACFVALGAPACASTGCPKPGSTPAERATWEKVLAAKKVLSLDPAGEIAIKRDVRDFTVSVDAKPFADAFHAVLIDPNRHFGLITVDRTQADVGKPFAVGQRFQGRYDLGGALESVLGDDVKQLYDDLETDPDFAEMTCEIENKSLSDFGIITDLVLGPPDAKELRFAYHYLDGSPIAGSSTFVVLQLSGGRSRVTQIFEYQEQSRSFADFFGTSGLNLHNGVVRGQVQQAAALAGGTILETDLKLPPSPTP